MADFKQEELSHGLIVEITSDEQWKDIQKQQEENKNQPRVAQVIDFYTTWCGPCKKLAPFLVQLASNEKYVHQIQFYKVQADQEEVKELVNKYEVTSFPTVVCLHGEKGIIKIKGYADKPEFQKEFIKIMDKLVE